MQAPPPFPRKLLAPRHWPIWLGVAVIRALVWLPSPWVIHLGAAVGAAMTSVLRSRQHVIRRNLELCFPDLDAGKRDAMRREASREMGRMLGEFAVGWFASEDKLKRMDVKVEGFEHYESVCAQGRGVLLVGGHFSHLELCGRLISHHAHSTGHTHIAGMYRKMDSEVFEYVVRCARARYTENMFEKYQLRATVKYLKQGGTVWYAPDQDMRGKDSVFAPFFGIPAATLTATHHLARLSGAAVIPFFHRRTPDGGYVLRMEAPLTDFPGDDVTADSARVNAVIERMVREAPTQYLWAHKRFKTRPPGQPAIY